MFWPLFLLIAPVIMALASVLPAAAHMPPPPHLVRLMLDALGNARALEVSQRLVIYPDRLVGPETTMTEHQWYDFPDRFRSEILSGEVKRLHVRDGYEHITAIDGRVLPAGGTPYDAYRDILLYRNSELLEERLTAMGVNLQVVSLGRFLDKFVYIIGALYPDESVSQLWLDKTTFLPQRLLISEQTAGGPAVDIHYTQWRERLKSWHPMRIEFYENRLLSREAVVDTIKVLSTMDAGIFDIRTIRKQLSATAAAAEQPPGEPTNEVEEAIETFRKRFE